MLFCLTAVDTEMLFEVVFVLEGFPTLQTFELPGLHGLIQGDGTLGGFLNTTLKGANFQVLL